MGGGRGPDHGAEGPSREAPLGKAEDGLQQDVVLRPVFALDRVQVVEEEDHAGLPVLLREHVEDALPAALEALVAEGLAAVAASSGIVVVVSKDDVAVEGPEQPLDGGPADGTLVLRVRRFPGEGGVQEEQVLEGLLVVRRGLVQHPHEGLRGDARGGWVAPEAAAVVKRPAQELGLSDARRSGDPDQGDGFRREVRSSPSSRQGLEGTVQGLDAVVAVQEVPADRLEEGSAGERFLPRRDEVHELEGRFDDDDRLVGGGLLRCRRRRRRRRHLGFDGGYHRGGDDGGGLRFLGRFHHRRFIGGRGRGLGMRFLLEPGAFGGRLQDLFFIVLVTAVVVVVDIIVEVDNAIADVGRRRSEFSLAEGHRLLHEPSGGVIGIHRDFLGFLQGASDAVLGAPEKRRRRHRLGLDPVVPGGGGGGSSEDPEAGEDRSRAGREPGRVFRHDRSDPVLHHELRRRRRGVRIFRCFLRR
mmetsp:Transcript_1630/g.4177  ORF Transcript_1630/g.4177 Transcript_1630/m.4177 type:complete len:471 (+) Transcript_1630:922-2334(+)